MNIFLLIPSGASIISKIEAFGLIGLTVIIIALLPLSVLFAFIYYDKFNFKISLGDAVLYALRIWPKLASSTIIYLGTTLLGLFLLIIPGFLLFLSEIFSPFLVATENYSISKAYKESRNLTSKFLLDIWLVLSSIAVLSVLVTVILAYFVSSYGLSFIIGVNALLIPFYLVILFNFYIDIRTCSLSNANHWKNKSTLISLVSSFILAFVLVAIFTHTPLAVDLGIKKFPPANPSTNQPNTTPTSPSSTPNTSSTNSVGQSALPSGESSETSDYAPEYPKSYDVLTK